MVITTTYLLVFPYFYPLLTIFTLLFAHPTHHYSVLKYDENHLLRKYIKSVRKVFVCCEHCVCAL